MPRSARSVDADLQCNGDLPLHVGHLRSLVIGESLRRLLVAQGHHVVYDVHVDDWGLQMGMLIAAIRRRWPDLSFFGGKDVERGNILAATELPFDIEDLQLFYPEAAAACKADPERMAEAREATAMLQSGRPGYVALWTAIRQISFASHQQDIDALEAHFDLWFSESDAQSFIGETIDSLRARKIAIEDDNAIVVDVTEAVDKKPMPPLLLAKSDGASTYATTDLATIFVRTCENVLDRIIYVVDQRQSLHFEQVFRAARLAGFARGVELIHVGFGTVNGSHGKPYRTRDGGIARLRDLLTEAIEKAR